MKNQFLIILFVKEIFMGFLLGILGGVVSKGLFSKVYENRAYVFNILPHFSYVLLHKLVIFRERFVQCNHEDVHVSSAST
jgi:hypothetical protein